ncbi:MAG: IPT/TIG domain-containing protein, partial [Terriglobales bacterium]
MKRTSSATLAVVLAFVLFTVGCGGPGGDPPKSQGTAPAIASITPNTGSPSGGTNVTITGTGFQSGARVIFGGIDGGSVTVVSGGQITCSTPVHAAGAVTVEVRNPRNAGSAFMSNGFNFEGLSLTSISPTSGTIRGGTTVTLNGTRFDSSTAVTFGGVAATAKTLISSTQMTAVTPAKATAGAVNVQVGNSDGQTSSLTNAFNYLALTVTSLSATSGPSSGGTGVTILGSQFQPGATVKFGGTSASVTYKSSTELQAITPVHTSGIVDMVVTNPSPDSQTATKTGAFTYANAVTVTSVSPANGPPTGGT